MNRLFTSLIISIRLTLHFCFIIFIWRNWEHFLYILLFIINNFVTWINLIISRLLVYKWCLTSSIYCRLSNIILKCLLFLINRCRISSRLKFLLLLFCNCIFNYFICTLFCTFLSKLRLNIVLLVITSYQLFEHIGSGNSCFNFIWNLIIFFNLLCCPYIITNNLWTLNLSFINELIM